METTMQARLTTKPEHEVIAAIQVLDLESVKLRLMDPELGKNWSRAYAESIEAAYKRYLAMLVKYQDAAEDIMLSKDVDEFWHTHILQTIKYAEDCERVFGTFLHHNPHIGERTAADLEKRSVMAEKTRSLYEREFGNAENAKTAWLGDAIVAQRAAANSSAVIRAGSGAITAAQGAYSSAAIKAEKAAYSSVAIRAQDAAYSSMAIKADAAAYSSAAIRAEHAAYSSAAIHEKAAAYSSAAIKAERAAYSSVAIRAENAAYSSMAIKADAAAYSSAAIRAEHAAYSSAVITGRGSTELRTGAGPAPA
jgi:hypothetical protein